MIVLRVQWSEKGSKRKEKESGKKRKEKNYEWERGGLLPGVAAHPAAGTSTVSEQR